MANPSETKKTIAQQLLDLLPTVLPDEAVDAITGTELIARLRSAGLKGSTENSLRQYFSNLSSDPETPIAKVSKGHGYFKRAFSGNNGLGSQDAEASLKGPSEATGRDNQLEEKFRALFMRWVELEGTFPVLLEHTKGAKQVAGINKWKYPDVVTVKWNVNRSENGREFDHNVLDVMRGLGEQPFQITSTELKVEIRPATLREAFFQCVSNSKWAHVAQLVVATDIAEQLVVDELKRLGASYQVTVLSFGLSRKAIEDLPDASSLRRMSSADIDEVLKGISVKVIATGEDEEQLDWDQIRDLQKQLDELNHVLAWIAKCLKDGRAYNYEEWSKTLK